MSRRRICTSVVLAAFLVVTAVTTTDALATDRRSSKRATKTVRAIVSHWSPTTVRISRGDTIKWRAVSGTHTVNAFGGNWAFSKPLSTGAVQGRTFRRAGTFLFRCTIHSTLTSGRCSGMCGKVVVRR